VPEVVTELRAKAAPAQGPRPFPALVAASEQSDYRV